MLYIFDENLCIVPRFKSFIKTFLNLGNRGPRAVFDSLIRGLREQGVSFAVNKKNFKADDVICVLSGVCSLRKAIRWKRSGLVKKIVAGPNIVVFPGDANGLICDPAVDVILVPAQWVKNLWISLHPELASRIVVWAAGVRDPGATASSKRSGLLVYKKHVPIDLFNTIIQILNVQRIQYTVLEYGTFQQRDYFSHLNSVKGVIYLTESESQGVALVEAWIRNVPTLVWDMGIFRHGGQEWRSASAAPYLVQACGERFVSEKDFATRLDDFLRDISKFQPRKYALEHFIDKKSAESFLKIIFHE